MSTSSYSTSIGSKAIVKLLYACIFVSITAGQSIAQISIQAGSTVTQDFTIGTAFNSALPANWKVDKISSGARTVGTYAAAVLRTERSAGINMSSTASNGIYNYAAGDTSTTTDRAIGWMSSGSGTKSGNLYAWLQNTGASSITLTVGYAVEKYRMGSNAAGFAIQLYYSTDGTTWTSAGGSFLTTIPSDGSNSGYTSVPGMVFTVPSTSLAGVTVTAGSSIYLAWNFSVASGSTTTNAQGLGIDDVSISATSTAGPAPTTVQFSLASSSVAENGGPLQVNVDITNPSSTAATTVNIAMTGGTAVNGTTFQTLTFPITLTFPAGDATSKSFTVTPIDNTTYGGSKTAVFALQNVSGGTSASLGSPSTHTLTILENELPPEPTVIVNEYQNTSGDLASSESIELIVVKDSLDMRGFQLCDATSSGTYPYGAITFSTDALWSNLPAGLIIVVGGYLSVPYNDIDPSDGIIMVQTPSAWGTSNQYFTLSSNAVSIAGASDAVAIRNASGSHIHGLAHGTACANALPAGQFGWYNNATSIATGSSVYFARTGAAMTAQDFNVNTYTTTGTASIGFANDADGNLGFLRSCRSRTIANTRQLAGTFFWDVVVAGGTVNQSGTVNICNSLTVREGTWNENGLLLQLDGNGNVQNGAGLGKITVGDNAGTSAVLNMLTNFGTITGTTSFNYADGIVNYNGATIQTVLPTAYNSIAFNNGGTAFPKIINGAMSVTNGITIGASAALTVTKPNVIILSPTGTFTNNGSFTGAIQTTRPFVSVGSAVDFGGLGMIITPTSTLPTSVMTVKLNSGEYIWVNNTPSILRNYEVSGTDATTTGFTVDMAYKDTDLNGQIESSLGGKFKPSSTGVWETRAGTLNTGTNRMVMTSGTVTGTWTAHSIVPQGSIVPSPIALQFEVEEFGSLPSAQTVTIANANGSGSIIEWTASGVSSPAPAWLDLSPISPAGVNAGSFTVSINRTNLTPGVYSGSITITDTHASNNPVIIPVTYTVIAKRRICVGADTIFFKVSYRFPDPTKQVAVLNCGGSFGPGAIRWSVTGAASWLTLSSVNGLEGQVFLMTAKSLSLMPGNYYGSVTITGSNSITGAPIENSPLTIPVVLEVEPYVSVRASVPLMTPGDVRTITNSFGQKVAVIRLISGTIYSLTPRMYPMTLPPYGIARKRYVYRYYTFSPAGVNYVAELTLFYSNSELRPSVIINPWLIQAFRQPVKSGAWLPTTSTCAPVTNSVTITNITDLSGIWGMAAPFISKSAARNFRGGLQSDGSTLLRWFADDMPGGSTFRLERMHDESESWEDIGDVGEQTAGMFEVRDMNASRLGNEYRLSLFDSEGMIGEPEVIRIEGTAKRAGNGSIADLGPSANPVKTGSPAGIRFHLYEDCDVSLSLYDINGRQMIDTRTTALAKGTHELPLLTTPAPGVYFYHLQTGKDVVVGKMVVGR
jgi:hypothetical protein